jgi:hypothetical protein
MTIRNWSIKWSVCLSPSSLVSPPALDAPSADVPPATSTDLKLSPFASTFRHQFSATSPDISDPVLDLHWFHPILVLLSRPFHPTDFVNSFLDRDRPSTSSLDVFFDVSWYYSTLLGFPVSPLLNKLVLNRVSASDVTLDFWMCHFSPGVDTDQRTSAAVNFLNVLFLTRG